MASALTLSEILGDSSRFYQRQTDCDFFLESDDSIGRKEEAMKVKTRVKAGGYIWNN